MGNFLTNYQLRTNSAAAVASHVKTIAAGRAAISPYRNGWITLYDETSESQDQDELHRVAGALSAALHTVVLAFLVHDSDILRYLLYNDGLLVDEFDSQPDYFSEVDDATWDRLAGTPQAFARCCPVPPTQDALHPLFARVKKRGLASQRQYADEIERLHAFALQLGMDPRLMTLGYTDYREMCTDSPDLFKGFRKIKGGAQSAEQRRPRSFIDLVRHGDFEAVRHALQQRADPNQMLLPQHFSAIACAADAGQLEIAMLLLDAGADPSAGKLSTIEAAVVRGLKPLVRTLLARGVDPRRAELDVVLAAVLFYEDLELLEMLVAHGASVQGTPVTATPLVAAVSTNKPRLLHYLLAAGAEPNAPASRGMTPLMVAAAKNDAAMIKTLLHAGANVHATNDHGQTALDLARLPAVQQSARNPQGNPSGTSETIQLLLDAASRPPPDNPTP
jgi:hypothetical protein